jgi:nitrate reductase beta subunit
MVDLQVDGISCKNVWTIEAGAEAIRFNIRHPIVSHENKIKE